MRRFLTDGDGISDGFITLRGSEYNHIVRVLRMKPGETVGISDGSGAEYECELESVNAEFARLRIISEKAVPEKKAELILFQAVPKSDRMEYIIQKCTELGISAIYPVITARTVVRIDDKNRKSKLERWRRIAAEASKQCARPDVPEIFDFIDFEQAMELASKDMFCIFPYEREQDKRLSDILLQDQHKISFFIGPEGGFEDSEAALASDKNMAIVSLGRRILRTDTAPVAVLSIIMHKLGEI